MLRRPFLAGCLCCKHLADAPKLKAQISNQLLFRSLLFRFLFVVFALFALVIFLRLLQSKKRLRRLSDAKVRSFARAAVRVFIRAVF